MAEEISDKKTSELEPLTRDEAIAANAVVPVAVPGIGNGNVVLENLVGDKGFKGINCAIYGVTSYSDVMAMLDGGTDTTGPKSKGIPLVCVLKYDMEIPYPVTGSYDTLTRGTTMFFTGIDYDGIHFGHTIAHRTSGTMPPVTIFAEALLNSQNVWSIKLRNSFQVAGIDSGSGASVIRITPGMSTTATLVLDNPNSANSKAYMLLPTTVTQGSPKVSNVSFIGFDTFSGMTPCMRSILAFAGTTVNGVNYQYQTPSTTIFTVNHSADAGIAGMDITVYKDNNDFAGYNLRIGTEFLAIAKPYDRTKQYAVGDYCITKSGLWRLSTPYTPPANFTQANWTNVTLIDLVNEKISGLVVAPEYDDTLAYPVVGTLRMHKNVLYKSNVAIPTAEAWTAAHWDEVSVTEELTNVKSLINAVPNGGNLTDSATIDVPNNALSKLTTSQNTLTLNVNLNVGDIANFIVEINASSNVALTVTSTTGGVTSPLKAPVTGSISLENGHFYQVKCVGSCWFLKEYAIPSV